MKEVNKLLLNLLRTPSISGKENRIGRYLVERLRKKFKVIRQKAGNSFNVLAVKGTPKVILTTHLDTVNGELKVKEDKKYIYGRGACDAKGCIASMIIAGEKAVKQGLNDFGMLFDVSEEGGFLGVKEALNLVNPEFVIVGEPTSMKIVTGQKGTLGIKIKCYGKTAHSAMPQKGKSAINELINLLSNLRKQKLPSNKIFGKTTMNIGKISGGVAGNIVPDYAEAELNLRTVNSNNNAIKVIKKVIPEKNIEIKYSFEPSLIKNNKLINELNYSKIKAPYFSEMYFWNKKTKAIVFGPGEIKYAHSDKEKISKKELELGTKAYIEILRKLIKRSDTYE